MLPNQPLCGMLWSMTDTLTPTLLASLQEVSDPFCLSLFLPTHRTGDLEQDQVRLKNLLKDAAEKLCTAGMRKPDVDALLERAHALLKDGLFWRHLEDGLAIFAAKNHCTILRLPLALPEESIIDDHFHTEHIVSIALGAHKHFFLLAVSQKHVRLLRVGANGFEQELLKEAHPEKLWEVLGEDKKDKEIHQHSVGSPGGGTASVFHGGGGEKDVKKQEIREYLTGISQKVETALKTESAPLLLACADPLFGIYREVQHYPHLLSERIHGNTDHLSDKELLAKAHALFTATSAS